MTNERWSDQLDRLRCMAEDEGDTWDLSDNDRAALAAAVKRLDGIGVLSRRWQEYARIAESQNRAEQWTRCVDALTKLDLEGEPR